MNLQSTRVRTMSTALSHSNGVMGLSRSRKGELRVSSARSGSARVAGTAGALLRSSGCSGVVGAFTGATVFNSAAECAPADRPVLSQACSHSWVAGVGVDPCRVLAVVWPIVPAALGPGLAGLRAGRPRATGSPVILREAGVGC